MLKNKILFSLLAVLFLGIAFFYFTEKGKHIKRRVRLELVGMNVIGPKNEPKTDTETEFDYAGTFMDMEGNRVSLNQFKGKTLFINIWASWCGPCRIEMPYIHSLYGKLKDTTDIAFLMIATDEDFNKSKNFIQDKGYTFPIYHADEGLNSSLFTKAIPTTVVVSPEGKVIYYLNGTNNFDTDQFRDLLTSGSQTAR
ncbi:TlpA family protein disulfide reductase [Aquiflexum sp. TKW24L]|uniref:TlpA family protein disulfide reductase n=1 Tax=Aquiflexum sp. TKW24L TaxID=2942212 RepID=UPI0020BD8ABB|nr:TlpA disulfide reductase family protein [Aquiflexum sp. TKW24L]MCL6259042.1 TlpA family protein disulfide reductase [Aquiflexum sp. TKW24L]